MKNLTDWFDRVYIINRQDRPERLKVLLDHLTESRLADTRKVIVYPAIIGGWTTTPADWTVGRGPWGCLRSHQRILEDVIHVRRPDDEDEMAIESTLILEDDAFFVEGALEELQGFMLAVPKDWGQIYLGGQHWYDPKPSGVVGVKIGTSVNRTHAYAVSKRAIQHLYRHISYATDYRGKENHQVDHQIELAHRRGDWPVYCPDSWLAGQRSGFSDVSEAMQEERLWL